MLKSFVAEEKYRLHLHMKQQVQSPVSLCSEPHCPLICKGYHTLPSKLCVASMPIEGAHLAQLGTHGGLLCLFKFCYHVNFTDCVVGNRAEESGNTENQKRKI